MFYVNYLRDLYCFPNDQNNTSAVINITVVYCDVLETKKKCYVY